MQQQTQASITPWAITHLKDNFRDSDKYVPERWLKDRPSVYEGDKRDASQPFSVGPRNCIGKKSVFYPLIISVLVF